MMNHYAVKTDRTSNAQKNIYKNCGKEKGYGTNK